MSPDFKHCQSPTILRLQPLWWLLQVYDHYYLIYAYFEFTTIETVLSLFLSNFSWGQQVVSYYYTFSNIDHCQSSTVLKLRSLWFNDYCNFTTIINDRLTWEHEHSKHSFRIYDYYGLPTNASLWPLYEFSVFVSLRSLWDYDHRDDANIANLVLYEIWYLCETILHFLLTNNKRLALC